MGFGEICLDAQLPAALAVAPLTGGRENQEARFLQGAIGADRGGELEAVLIGHLRIENRQVVRRSRSRGAAQRLEARVGAGRFVYGHPLRPQHVPDDPPVGFVVVHHQQPASAE